MDETLVVEINGKGARRVKGGMKLTKIVKIQEQGEKTVAFRAKVGGIIAMNRAVAASKIRNVEPNSPSEGRRGGSLATIAGGK